MIRKSLYIAASAVALLAGAQAQAATISGTGTFAGVKSGDTSAAYKLAQELTYFSAFSSATAAAATQGSATFNLNAQSAFTTGQSLLLTVDVAGGVFTSGTATISSATGSACLVDSVVPVTPVAAGATSAQYLVQLSGNCSSTTATAQGIAISVPVQVTGNMTIGAKLEQSFGGQLINVDGGRASARFVNVAPAFSATVSATGTGAVAQVSQGYRTLSGAGTIGVVTVTADTASHKDLAGALITAGDIQGTSLTATALTGSFTGFNLTNAGQRFVSGTSSATISTVRVSSIAAGVASAAIAVVDNTDTATTAGINADAVIPASTFSLAAAVDLAPGLTDFTAVGSLAPVTRDGTSFVAPWIALGATSANSTIRLANNGSADTGPITMTLTSTNGGAPTTKTVTISAAQVVAGSLSASGGIPAGGTVSISGAALKTAFGTTAANGDIEVTIEAQPQFISGKVRVTQASGQIFETSLGNLRNPS